MHTIHQKIAHYPRVALVLQGGGALGAYQAGVVEGLVENNVSPSWVAGISIGAFNSAILAGNAPKDRLEKLHGFWDTICREKNWLDLFITPWANTLPHSEQWKKAFGWADAVQTVMSGQRGFFAPRTLWLPESEPNQVSVYRTDQLASTLKKYVNFDRINEGSMRLSVGAVNVETGNFVYFDNRTHQIGVEHIMASGALPPGLPAIKVGNEYFWDGGLVSNTPLSQILEEESSEDTLIFQVDLWSAKGQLPRHLADAECRRKDIVYSSKTRLVTDMLKARHKNHLALKKCFDVMTDEQRKAAGLTEDVMKAAVTNIMHLIYKDRGYEGFYKDFEFSRSSMREHWEAGLKDIRNTLEQIEWFEKPALDMGFKTHDIHALKPTT
jgi:NTE family protein